MMFTDVNSSTEQLIIGFLLGGLIGYLAYRAGALTRSGGWAAAIVGGLIFGLGGFPWAVLLLAFFLSSSLLSRAFTNHKTPLNERSAKGSRRDHAQVLANGGLGAALALAYVLVPEQGWQWIAFAGAMAAVNADTWATELGVLSVTPPRLIINGKVVPGGTSGGVTILGYMAALGGAFLIGLGAVAFSLGVGSSPLVLGVITLAGIAGASFDSLLGATLQSIYHCPACDRETERNPTHGCGMQTTQVRGWSWLNNDVVNFACSLAGAATALVAWWLFL
jgi:uncharacterized protein (TIGR00297 family)